MFEKAKKICEYDVPSFKKPVLPGFQYRLELLKTNDPDYKLLANSIITNDSLREGTKQKTQSLKIYRVISNEKSSTKSNSSNQILLLHGTKAQNVEGILKTGFKPSIRGLYGPGVYLTNSFNYAYNYGMCFATEDFL